MPEPTTTFHDSSDGVRVAAHDYGGLGHPTFFLHGTGLVSRMWEPVIKRLGPEFRCIAVDLRAHGATQAHEGIRFHDHRMAADLCAVTSDFGAEQAWAVGHSMGSATTVRAGLDQPGTFSSVWGYEPIMFPRATERPTGAFDFVEATKRRRPVFESRASVIESFGSRPPLDELDPECLEAYVQHGFIDQHDGSVRLACEPLLESRAYEDFLQDGWDRLVDVSFPVRVAYGDQGGDRPSEAAPAIADRLPLGELELFEGSGHFGCFDRLDRVVASIESWFLGDR